MIVTRFAPAPTGFLHLGHVVNAIYVWGLARAQGGRVLLRIEDHDRVRSRREFERAILEDLDWLGFQADAPLVRQSDRTSIYEAALGQLRAAGLTYACECSRAAIAATARPGHERRYPGTCAGKHLTEGPGRGVRVRLRDSVERFVDLRHGPQEHRPHEQGGDLLIRDRDGNWTYQFAVTADDLEQGITLVVRGDDLLPSTGRQIQLARLLGRDRPPEFFHHPLVMKSADQKLSKADNDTSIGDLRAHGMTAADVLGRAAAMVGFIERERPILVDETMEIVRIRHGVPKERTPADRSDRLSGAAAQFLSNGTEVHTDRVLSRPPASEATRIARNALDSAGTSVALVPATRWPAIFRLPLQSMRRHSSITELTVRPCQPGRPDLAARQSARRLNGATTCCQSRPKRGGTASRSVFSPSTRRSTRRRAPSSSMA